jgi:hypothetical protein
MSAPAPTTALSEKMRRYESSKSAHAHTTLSAVARRSDGTIPSVRLRKRAPGGVFAAKGGVFAAKGGGGGGGGGGEDAASDDDGGDDDGDGDGDDDGGGSGDESDDALAPLASALFPDLTAAHNAAAAFARTRADSRVGDAAATTTATTARATRKRPRFRLESEFSRSLQSESRTLATTTIASFQALREDFGKALTGDTAETGIEVARNTPQPAPEAINEFYNALLTSEPYWVRAAHASRTGGEAALPSMPAYDAAYCARFRREAHAGRRACSRAAAEMCVGQAMMTHPDGAFAYMEFLTPSEDDLFVRTGELPAATRLCEMCIRHYVNFRCIETRLRDHVAKITLNPHTHITDVPGGYRKEACIQQVPGFADGIFGTFRHFDTSEYVASRETLPDGTRVRGHDEAAEVFF